MHTFHHSIKAMRSILICFDYQKMRNRSRRQIPEMSLSEDKTVNLHGQVRYPHLTGMKLLMRKQKMPTANPSTKRIGLPSIRSHTLKISPIAGTSVERTRLPGAPQQQLRNQAKYCQQLQLQLQLCRQGVVSQEIKVKPLQQR